MDYENTISIIDQNDHADLHNYASKAQNIVLLGSSFEIYQLAATIRTHFSKLGHHPNISIVDDENSEIYDMLGEDIMYFLENFYKKNKVMIVWNALITGVEEDGEKVK